LPGEAKSRRAKYGFTLWAERATCRRPRALIRTKIRFQSSEAASGDELDNVPVFDSFEDRHAHADIDFPVRAEIQIESGIDLVALLLPTGRISQPRASTEKRLR